MLGRQMKEIYHIIQSPYVRGDEPVMQEVIFKKRVFNAMSSTEHRAMFAKLHKDITVDKPTFEEMINFFTGCNRDEENSSRRGRSHS